MYKQQDSSTSHGATAEAAQRWPMTQAEGLPHPPQIPGGSPISIQPGAPLKGGLLFGSQTPGVGDTSASSRPSPLKPPGVPGLAAGVSLGKARVKAACRECQAGP